MKVKSCIPESPIWCPKIVELRCVTLREYPPNGRSGSSVNVIVTEIFIGPESSRACGDWVEDLACPLVTVLSGVVVSLMRCFKVSFSDIQKSKSLNLRRKVFQSLNKYEDFNQISKLTPGCHFSRAVQTSTRTIPPAVPSRSTKIAWLTKQAQVPPRLSQQRGKVFTAVRRIQPQPPPDHCSAQQQNIHPPLHYRGNILTRSVLATLRTRVVSSRVSLRTEQYG